MLLTQPQLAQALAGQRAAGAHAEFGQTHGTFELSSRPPSGGLYLPVRDDPRTIDDSLYKTMAYSGTASSDRYLISVFEHVRYARLDNRVLNAETQGAVSGAEVKVDYATPLTGELAALFPTNRASLADGAVPPAYHILPGRPFTLRVKKPGFQDHVQALAAINDQQT